MSAPVCWGQVRERSERPPPPEEAARAARNVATIDPEGRAQIVAADGVPFLAELTGTLELLYLDADNRAYVVRNNADTETSIVFRSDGVDYTVGPVTFSRQ